MEPIVSLPHLLLSAGLYGGAPIHTLHQQCPFGNSEVRPIIHHEHYQIYAYIFEDGTAMVGRDGNNWL